MHEATDPLNAQLFRDTKGGPILNASPSNFFEGITGPPQYFGFNDVRLVRIFAGFHTAHGQGDWHVAIPTRHYYLHPECHVLVFIGKGAAVVDRLANLIAQAFYLALTDEQFQEHPEELKLRFNPILNRVAIESGLVLSIVTFFNR